MESRWIERLEKPLLGAAVLVFAWGVLGSLQMRSTGQGGYSTGLGARVEVVEENGPAEVGGLMVDDRITVVDGIPVGNPWSNPSRMSLEGGERQSLVVDRGGETQTVEVTWESRAPARWRSLLLDFVVTLSFLGFGLWALLASGTMPGLLLAMLGLGYGVVNFRGPSVGPLGPGMGFIQQNLSVFYTAILAHFLMVFPGPKRIRGRLVPGWPIYLAFLPLLAFGLAEWVIFPAFLDQYRAVVAYTDLLYMVLCLIALAHTWIVLPRDERRSTGFRWILSGLAIAIGPFLVLGFLGVVLPGFVLPGSEYLVLLGGVIPGSMALAVVMGHRSLPKKDAPTP
jgi:hypothetical protein